MLDTLERNIGVIVFMHSLQANIAFIGHSSQLVICKFNEIKESTVREKRNLSYLFRRKTLYKNDSGIDRLIITSTIKYYSRTTI